ncbi:MAG: glycosyltransferase family 4 protein [Verrucomicrobiota bacterium]
MLNWRDPKNPLAGGAERVSLGYLSALARHGHEVYWFSNDYPGAMQAETIEGVQVVRGGGMGTSVLQAWRWYRRQQPFDLVIDQHHGIPWYAPWWCRTNCVAYIHEVLGPIWKAFYPGFLGTFGQWQERWTHWLYRNVPFWTACESTRDNLRRHGVRDVTIIRYGVHTKAVPELEVKPLLEPLRLIAVSRLAPNKRIDHAILTLKSLTERGIKATLTIVGSGGIESRLRELAAAPSIAESVVFTGALSEQEKDALLRKAHFLLHTSQREGWGLNVIEANAMGTPAAVYPVAGLIESTLHDETGIVAQDETPEALAAGLLDLMKRPERYQFFRRKAWERAQTFHWDNILPQACAWLETQAKAGGRRRP